MSSDLKRQQARLEALSNLRPTFDAENVPLSAADLAVVESVFSRAKRRKAASDRDAAGKRREVVSLQKLTGPTSRF